MSEIEQNKNFNNNNADIFHYDRIYIHKITKKTRDILFVEVNQKELNDNIFYPIHNLETHESSFFPKRIAILGDYKTGKTELCKYMASKIANNYSHCISITINSQPIQFANINDINSWIFDQWFIALSQYDNDEEFLDVFYENIRKFKERKGHEPSLFIDKLYLICSTYRKYLKIHPNAKFIIGFDQSNLIEKEEDFQPFFQFWRTFQGYWEMDNYFSELPVFVYVVGHRNWIDFVNLKDKVGRGVFDKWLLYDYWNNIDIEDMFKKRLLYAIKQEYHPKLIKYFLCNGIIEHFGKKLNVPSTQEYLDQFFGIYLEKFINDLQKNLKDYKDFLDYCKKISFHRKSDETYFFELEHVFVGTPALDYMPVFKYLSNNQDAKWFKDLFDLITYLYENKSVKFESKEFHSFKNLNHDFLYYNFTNSPLDNVFLPEYTPALFSDINKTLILNETFRSCLDAIHDSDVRGPIYVLKRFVKSKRIKRNFFDINKSGSEIKRILKKLQNLGSKMIEIINRWVVEKKIGIIQENQEIPEIYLDKFYKIKKRILELSDLYKEKSTNWAIYDFCGRELINLLVDETFPENAKISEYINFSELDKIRVNILSPAVSNNSLTILLWDAFKQMMKDLNDFNEKLKKPMTKPEKEGNKIGDNILLIIDGPNSSSLDLDRCVIYARLLSKNADILYFHKIGDVPDEFLKKLSRLGVKLQSRHKDIDHQIKDYIRKELKTENPPKTIVLASKDSDFADFIKNIRKNYGISFKLAISNYEQLATSLKMIFAKEDLKIFPKKTFEPQREQTLTQKIKETTQSYISIYVDNNIDCYDDLELGMRVKGQVIDIKKYGAFVDIGIKKAGLLHISEITNKYIQNIEKYIKIGDEKEFLIIRINREKKQFALSLKKV